MKIDSIFALMIEKGISAKELSEKTGISAGNISDWKSGRSAPKTDALIKLANFFGVSVDYLLGIKSAIPVSDAVFVPIYGKVAAGEGMFADDEIIGEQPIFPTLVKNINECFCLRVTGDSMLPRIQDGDIILVRKQTSVDSGTYAVVLIDDENGVVKKVVYDKDSVTLISINPNYPPRTFSGAELQRIQVVGKVIQCISNFN